jgi:hypothetical protein
MEKIYLRFKKIYISGEKLGIFIIILKGDSSDLRPQNNGERLNGKH